jgi:hypothetical protein
MYKLVNINTFKSNTKHIFNGRYISLYTITGRIILGTMYIYDNMIKTGATYINNYLHTVKSSTQNQDNIRGQVGEITHVLSAANGWYCTKRVLRVHI